MGYKVADIPGLGFTSGIPLLGKTGPGFGLSASLSQSVGQSDGRSSSVGTSRSVAVDMLGLKFDANVLNCVLIRSKKVMNGTTSFMSANAYHVCDDRVSYENLSETWFFVGFNETADRVLRDGLDTLENDFLQIIRGKKQFVDFEKRLQTKNILTL
jgi:hypothetical protein